MQLQAFLALLVASATSIALLILHLKRCITNARQSLAPVVEFTTDPDEYIATHPNLDSFHVQLPYRFLPPTTWVLSPLLIRKILALSEDICSFNHVKRRMNHHVFGLPIDIIKDEDMDAVMTAVEKVFHSELAPLRMQSTLSSFLDIANQNLNALSRSISKRHGTCVNIHSQMYTLVSVSAIQTFFGPSFPANDAVEHLRTVDQNLTSAFLPFMLRYPFGRLAKRSVGTKAQDAFQSLSDMIESWLRSDCDGLATSSEMVKAAASYTQQAKWRRSNTAKALGMFMVALTVNSSNVAAWLLLVIAQMPNLYAKIQAEADVVAGDGNDITQANLAESAPNLLATIQEVLRHFGYIQVIRHVRQDVTVSAPQIGQSVTLRKGWQVAMPLRAMHMHPAIWGDDTTVFDPMRFMDSAGKARVKDLGTFGGGSSICSGRHFAIPEIAGVVVMLLSRMTIDPADIQMDKDGVPMQAPCKIKGKDLDGTFRTIGWTGRKDDGKVTQSGIMRPDGNVYLRLRLR